VSQFIRLENVHLEAEKREFELYHFAKEIQKHMHTLESWHAGDRGLAGFSCTDLVSNCIRVTPCCEADESPAWAGPIKE
jgi:hypothetical protein